MRFIVSLVWLMYVFSQSVCEFDLVKCSNKFTCLTYPSFCTDDCEAIAAFQYNPAKEKIYIQLWVKAPYQYIAFGQKPSNNDNYMIKIRGQYCYYKNGILLGNFNGNLLDHPSSPEWYPESDGKVNDVNLIESSIDSDGSMMCKIERPLQSGASEYLYDLADSLLAAIAFGRVNRYGVPLYHLNKYAKSQTPMSFISATNFTIDQPSTTMLKTTPYQIPNTKSENMLFTTSAVIKELVTTQTAAPVATNVMNEFDPKKCGIHYNCFLQPDSCSTNCLAAASFQYINDKKVVQFQLWARSSQMWVGFGQRLPNELGNFMYKLQGQYCQGSSRNVPVFGSFNGNKLAPATPGEPQWVSEINGVTLLSAEIKPDGPILCKFERSISNIADLYDMSLPLSVAIASGLTLKEKPGYHSSYSISETPIDFLKTRYNASTNMSYSILVSSNPHGITSSNMSKIHGVLMIIAWLIFVTSGIFISRYMKPQLTEHVFGKECWFRLHQFCMALSIILICCSMFIIVRHLNGWSQNPDKHNWFGLAAVILCIFQPTFAFFRCKIDDEKRYIFTWVHRCVGILAWSVAVVAIVFGMAKFGIGNEGVVAFFSSIFIMFITLDIIKYYYESKHSYFPVIENHPMDTFTLSLQEVERPYPAKQVTMISNIFLVLIVAFSIVITFYYVKVILGA
ncbi:putative ferric-chelate reductase 1 isoform X4 [Hydra vulgaris]|uniref:ascorbate ferrireductase (transmembrane) n=2 Tax=Hydra vulgaris TaxID=6087 RepID=A0ABM4BJV3_HYDVU